MVSSAFLVRGKIGRQRVKTTRAAGDISSERVPCGPAQHLDASANRISWDRYRPRRLGEHRR